MNSNENVLSKASEDRASEEIQDAASRSLRGAQVKHLRVVHVDHFEAAVPLADYEQAAYRRRFCTLFVDDERTRTGGLGRVMFAQNAMGEALALKTMLPAANNTGTSDAATEEIKPEDASKRREQLRGRAFRREYEEHWALGGIKGVPRLYGYGSVDGAPAIVMEWIDGVTLAQAARQIAVDDAHRMSSLTVARIGRDLFDVLARFDVLDEGFVHRDISPSNVMVRTSHLSVEQQEGEGAFDLCLVDFGSATALQQGNRGSFTDSVGAVRLATPNYAPPEMLTNDISGIASLRQSASVDVYAAASVLFELVTGNVPYDLDGAAGQAEEPASGHASNNSHATQEGGKPGDAASPYLIKSSSSPRVFLGAHEAAPAIVDVLALEEEVAITVGKALLDFGMEPEEQTLRDALVLVDGQLADMLKACLSPKQSDRPSAEAMRDGLAAFCEHYGQNVARALRGTPLIPCWGTFSWLDAASPLALRRIVRSVGKAIALGVLMVSSLATGLLLDGALAQVTMGTTSLPITLNGIVVALALLVPALCARIASRTSRATRPGFLRGTCALLVATAIFVIGIGLLDFESVRGALGLYAALFAAVAAGWCPIVLDYAMAVVPALLAERRRMLQAADAHPALREREVHELTEGE